MKHSVLQKKQSRAGFSLVELSVVILILGIFFTMMFGVYAGVVRIASKQSPVSLERQKVLLALDNVRSCLEQTYYNGEVRRIVFVGKSAGNGDNRSDRVTLACANSGAERTGRASIREVSFYVKSISGQDTGTLIRREDEMVDDKPGEGGLHYPLVNNIVSFALKYSLNGKDWFDSWNSQQSRRFPKLIQIQIRARIQGKESLFETVAYPGLYYN